jgi:hypothetical protein
VSGRAAIRFGKERLLQTPAGSVPRVAITDAGIYVSFERPSGRVRTIVRRPWPHLAVDINRSGKVIGIEAVPLPHRFSLRKIAQEAGVHLPARGAARAQIFVQVPPGRLPDP